MTEWAAPGIGRNDGMTTQTAKLDRQHIVFLASQQAIYQCLSHAAQKHFTAFAVDLVDHLSLDDIPADNVRLLLLGCGQAGASINCIAECRRRFPGAAIGLVIEHAGQVFDRALFDQHLVQGVLPLTLPLDVWLAVMSLLVAGGEYHSLEDVTIDGASSPPPVDNQQARMPGIGAPQAMPTNAPNLVAVQAPQPDEHVIAGEPTGQGIDSLTARERQILQLVSQGYQNKLIANRMALSEHTVKAHVHNLIAKLRVTNRTQAAATFLYGHDATHPAHADLRADDRLVAPYGS